MIEKNIVFFGQQTTMRCDGKCNKAWGINSRPRQNDEQETYLLDSQLGDAPENPGTYEGGHGKPFNGVCIDPELMNKWCARECERCIVGEGELPSFN